MILIESLHEESKFVDGYIESKHPKTVSQIFDAHGVEVLFCEESEGINQVEVSLQTQLYFYLFYSFL